MKYDADAFNAEVKRENALWHADLKLEQFIVDLFATLKPDLFVETGTHMGWTAGWIAERYSTRIFTCEVTDQYFKVAGENLAPYSNITIEQADSRTFLRKHFSRFTVSNCPVFWLDAHWYPPVPLREECWIVSALPRYVVLIDDFECKDPDFEGDDFGYDEPGAKCNLAYVKEAMGNCCWRPNYPSQPGNKGYGLFMKGIDYKPPEFLKEDVL